MKYTKLTPDNIPEGEVLAACFDKNSDLYKTKLIGTIKTVSRYIYQKDGFKCTSEDGITYHGITHYIDLTPFDL